ncbi:MAG: VWA domain-containing protein, partial [bacterium]|nr:VWA domain-containing protein [bacterium]
DNASYSNIRRFINKNQLPPKDSVRIEEMINYFTYDYPQPKGRTPFSITTEVSQCPWNNQHKLVHIGLQGKRLDYDELKPSNLVFLVDSSGSMRSHNKLPLLKKSLGMLLDGLDDKDKVSIVAYAGSAGLVLPSTPASGKNVILRAIDQLSAGGSTAGGAGIQLAYKVAKENFIKNGNNRVILCTDGDFNVGVSSTGSLVRYIEEKRKDDVYLTICGFGMGNYKDGRMEQISNAGNGNYFYIDTAHEARKVFVKEMRANMFAIAKD